VDWTLELIVVPVAEIDRAKEFYVEKAGFGVLVDHRAGERFRVVQLLPRGSACAIALVTGNGGGTPGAVKGLHLVVADIEAARAELVDRGAEVSGFFHFGEGGQMPGTHPTRDDYGTFCSFDDPDGNMWLVQEVSSRAAAA
jgi:catechol 2,3-dioxygenase-like lactoylglutathione lyase family enzyme